MGRSKTIKRRYARSTMTASVLALFFIFPFYYMLIQSLTPWDRIDQSIFPSAPTAKSYVYLLNNGGSANRFLWLRALLNSIIVSGVTTFIAVSTALLMGYAVTKLRFRGRRFLFSFLLFQMFFPAIILLVPQYMLMRPLVNSYPGMILPTAVSVWAIFMYVNYFKTLPSEMFEAARIDGASEARIAFAIALPICKTVSVIVFLSLFLGRWSELMWDMLIAPDVRMQTLNVLISTQFKPMGNLPGPLYAASAILTLPIVILFLAFSKYFREGITMQLK
jgi:multiple sugar transport system permease protein